jgi:hypothetical protein
MSVFISHWRFGDWTCKLKKPCFITVGYPLRGFEELGLVKSYSERNARLDTVSTERPCLATTPVMMTRTATTSCGALKIFGSCVRAAAWS